MKTTKPTKPTDNSSSNLANYLRKTREALDRLEVIDPAAKWPKRRGAAKYLDAVRAEFQAVCTELEKQEQVALDSRIGIDENEARRRTFMAEKAQLEGEHQAMIRSGTVDGARLLELRDQIYVLGHSIAACDELGLRLQSRNTGAGAGSAWEKYRARIEDARRTTSGVLHALEVSEHEARWVVSKLANRMRTPAELGLVLLFEDETVARAQEKHEQISADAGRKHLRSVTPEMLAPHLDALYHAAQLAIASAEGKQSMQDLIEEAQRERAALAAARGA